MLNDINESILNYLKPFFYVAETGSMRRAAALLYQTPSAISHQIQKLEEILGLPLFERSTGQPLKLLPAGRFLYDRIPTLDNTLFRLRSELKTFKNYQPPLRIGVLSLLQSKLIKTISECSQHCPDLHFSLFESHSSSHICHALLTGELDCALVFSERVPSTIKTLPLFASPLVLVVHHSLLDSFGVHPTWEQLLSLPFIYISANHSKTTELDPYAELQLSGTVRIQVDSPISAMDAVNNKLGAVIICQQAIEAMPSPDIRIYPLKNKKYQRNIALAMLPDANFSPDHDFFINFLKKSWKKQQPADNI